MAIAAGPTPDALMVPNGFKRGPTMAARMGSILAVAEPLLGVDRARGDRAWIRNQGPEGSFVTRDPDDTIYFPTHCPLRGRPRYRWVDGPDDIRRGYLTPEAAGFAAPPFDPVAQGLA